VRKCAVFLLIVSSSCGLSQLAIGKNHPRLVIFYLLEKKVIAKTIGTWKLIQGKPLTYN